MPSAKLDAVGCGCNCQHGMRGVGRVGLCGEFGVCVSADPMGRGASVDRLPGGSTGVRGAAANCCMMHKGVPGDAQGCALGGQHTKTMTI